VVLLRQQANAARTVLETLLASPGGIEIGEEEMLDSLSVLVLGAGIPSVWLTRRPDIARAEALLVAADADLLAARAALLPSLTLGTEISATAGSLRRVFDHPAYSLVSGLTAPIFDAGRLAAARDLSAAEREERLANYRRTILDAFSDVELALNEAWSLETQARLQTEELAQAQRALKLAEARYRAGAETLLTLLDAQRVFYAARDEALQLQLARLHAAVFLYKVGGGGWRGNRNEESKRDGSRHSPRRASIMNEVLLAGRLRRAKLRATFSRLKVLEMLAENPGSQRVDNIIRQLSERKLPVNIGSAYRALREMHAAGLVLCLRDAQHARRYCLKPESAAPALRLVCRDSGERLVFSNPEFHAHILAVAAQQELKLEGREFDLQARTEHRERTIRRFTGARPPDDNDPRKVWITLGKKPVHPMKTVPWAPA
jgi:Fe2+ or Zn2+ uptake regulation protein